MRVGIEFHMFFVLIYCYHRDYFDCKYFDYKKLYLLFIISHLYIILREAREVFVRLPETRATRLFATSKRIISGVALWAVPLVRVSPARDLDFDVYYGRSTLRSCRFASFRQGGLSSFSSVVERFCPFVRATSRLRRLKSDPC